MMTPQRETLEKPRVVVPAKAGTQFFLFGILLTLASSAFACGYCVEDKIAAVYDHAALTQARAQKHTTVYFAIDGAIRDSAPSLKKIVEGTKGVEKGSARVSVQAQALAVTFDPRRTALPAVQSGLEKALKPRGLELLLLDTK